MPLNMKLPVNIEQKSFITSFNENYKEIYFDEVGSYLAKYGSESGRWIEYSTYIHSGADYPYGIYAKDNILYYTIKTSKYGPSYTTTFVIENENTNSVTTSTLTLVASSSDITDAPYRNPIVYPIKNDDSNVIILLTVGDYDMWYKYSLVNASVTYLCTDKTHDSPSKNSNMTCTDGLNVYCYRRGDSILKINLTTLEYTTISDANISDGTYKQILLVNLAESGYILCLYTNYDPSPITGYLWDPDTNKKIMLKSVSAHTTSSLFRSISYSANTLDPQPNTFVGILNKKYGIYDICIHSTIYEININSLTFECVNYKSVYYLVYVPTHLKNDVTICPSERPRYGAYAFVNDIVRQKNLYFIENSSLSYDGSMLYTSVAGLEGDIHTMYKVYIE